MTIPDPLVYAALTPVLGSLLWVAKRFVEWVTGSRTDTADPIPAQQESSISGLSVRAYKEIVTMLKDEFDDHYMQASETREWFQGIEEKLEALSRRLELYIATHH